MNLKNQIMNNSFIRRIFYFIYLYKRMPVLHNFTIRKKLVISFLSISIVPLFISGMIQYFYLLNVMPTEAGNRIIQTLEQADKNVSYELNNIKLYLGTFQYNKELMDALNVPLELDYTNTINKVTQIRRILLNYGDYNIVDKYTTVYVNWQNEFKDLFNDYSFQLIQSEQEEQFYNKISSKTGELYWRGSHKLPDTINSHTFISTAKALISPDKHLIGVIEVHSDLQIFSDIIAGINLGGKSTVLMLDQDNNFICGSNIIDSDIKKISMRILESQSNGRNSDTLEAKVGSINSIITYKINNLTGWKLISVVPVEEITRSSMVLGTTNFIIIFFCILIAIAIAIPISFSISNPVNKLMVVMKSVENENFDVYVKPVSKDEIGDLCNYFNKMISKVKELIEKVYKVEIEKKEQELKALQAQINPHFLYNTLDTINWMAVCREADDIATMARSLANVFRFSLSKGNSVIPVNDEIELTKNYINIQQIRLADRLEVEYHLSEEIFNFEIVKLLLQPIIENSIIHGARESNEKIKIQLTGEVYDEKMLFTITDNGSGVNLEEVEQILKGSDKKTRKGYGIKNVNDRIKLYCGEGYGLKYFNNNGDGTRVEMWTKLISSDKEDINV